MVQPKLLSNLYPAKFIDTSVKSIFPATRFRNFEVLFIAICNVTKWNLKKIKMLYRKDIYDILTVISSIFM